ncbi:rod shape-determining protein MreC, partial [Flavonifractor plautii]
MAVESTNGMVGKIKSVSAHTSVVKLLTSEDKLNSASIKILLDEKKSSLGVLQSYDVKRGCYIV